MLNVLASIISQFRMPVCFQYIAIRVYFLIIRLSLTFIKNTETVSNSCVQFFKPKFREQFLFFNQMPFEFFSGILGANALMFHSFWAQSAFSLKIAEENSLDLLFQRARLHDAKHVLIVGSDWGGLAAYLLERLPDLKIGFLDFTQKQADYISQKLKQKKLTNFYFIQDSNSFSFDSKYDCVLLIENSLETFQKNYPYVFLSLKSKAKIFSSTLQYQNNEATLYQVSKEEIFQVHCQESWRISSKHYVFTLKAWYQNLLKNKHGLIELTNALQLPGTLIYSRWRLVLFSLIEILKNSKTDSFYIEQKLFEFS